MCFGGYWPDSARHRPIMNVAAISLVRDAYLCSSGKIQFGNRCTGSRVAASFGADPIS